MRRPTEGEQRLVFQPQRRNIPPSFDARTIRDLESQLGRQQESWERYFSKRNITPLVIEYECLAADYTGQIGRALKFLNLDESVSRELPPPRLVRQADELTDRWRMLLEA